MGLLLSRWIIIDLVCTRSQAVRTPLPEIPNMDGEIGRNASSRSSVDIFQGVQLQYTFFPASTIALAFLALSSWTAETC